MKGCLLTMALVVAVLAEGAAARGQAQSGATSEAPPPPAAKPVREVAVAQALVVLNKEARAAWPTDEAWPTQTSDFAQRHGFRVRNDDLVRVLARRLHREQPIEAYVKWQLLSFAPDLSGAPPDLLRRVIAVMPQLTPPQLPRLPALRGQRAAPQGLSVSPSMTTVQRPVGQPVGRGPQRPRTQTVTIRTGIEAGGAVSNDLRYVQVAIEAAQTELVALRRRALIANRPALAFRDQVIPLLPEKHGLRLTAQVQDLRDRLAIGDPSHLEALRRLEAATRTLPYEVRDNATVPKRVRTALAHEVRSIAGMRTRVVESIRAAPEGSKDPLDVTAQTVAAAPEALRAIVVRLMGEEAEYEGNLDLDADPVEEGEAPIERWGQENEAAAEQASADPLEVEPAEEDEVSDEKANGGDERARRQQEYFPRSDR